MTAHVHDRNIQYFNTDKPNVCRVYDTGFVNARIKEFDGKPIQAWKKAKLKDKKGNVIGSCIVELLIPARAIRFQPNNYKCRASSAHVVAIHKCLNDGYQRGDLGAKTRKKVAWSKYDKQFKYVVGTKIKPKKKFDKNHKQVCTSGIHFFLTAKEAANY